MKPIEQLNLNREDWKKENGVADLDARVKMKHTEQKMKPIEGGNLNVCGKMNEPGAAKKPHGQNLFVRFHFKVNFDDLIWSAKE